LQLNIWKNPVHLLSFGFGSGLSPWAPGTCGTAVAVIIYLLLPSMSWPVYLGFILLTFLLGIWLCHRTALAVGIHDPGGIVWDEFVGLWITLFLVPDGWMWIVLGFFLFRLLDILKPWPVKWADTQVEGGLGIMLDDVLAGIMAALCIQALAVLLVVT